MFGWLFNQVNVYSHLNRINDYYRNNLYYNAIEPAQAPVRATANANQRNSSNYYSSSEQLVRTIDNGHAFYTVPTESITQFGLPFNIYYRVKTYDKITRHWVQWIRFCFRFVCFSIPILRGTTKIDGSSIRYSINESEINYTPFIKIWRLGPVGCPGCTGPCGITKVSSYTKFNFAVNIVLLLGFYISGRILIKYNILK